MTAHEQSLIGLGAGPVLGIFTADVRTSLTGQFLMAAALQVRAAEEIESKTPPEVTETDQISRKGFVVGAIMQSTAALECWIREVMTYSQATIWVPMELTRRRDSFSLQFRK